MGKSHKVGLTSVKKSLAIFGLILGFLATASTAHAQPSFVKNFSPNSIGPDSTSTLTFTIDNTGGGPVSGLAFSDALPTTPGPMTIASPANTSTDCVDATITAPDGGGTISLTGGRLGTGGVCTINVDVTASTVGMYTNTTGDLTSSAGNSGTATANLTVATTLPGFSKSFAPSTVAFGGTSTLTYTIDNSANAGVLANLDFVDNFPSGIQIASPPNASTTCISAGLNDTTLTAPAGGSTVTLDANGAPFGGFEVLSGGATCSVSLDVVGSGLGMQNSVSGPLLINGLSAGTASATLNVTGTPLLLTKSFINDPVAPGDTVDLEFTIRNQNRSSSATNITFTDDLNAALTGLTASGTPISTCGGTLSGTSSLSFSGGSLAPEASCTFTATLDVPAGATTGSFTNTTSAITADIGGVLSVGAAASDNLRIEEGLPGFTKSFTNDPVSPGGTVTLEYTITNPSAGSVLSDLAFNDEFDFLPQPLTFTGATADVCGTGSSLSLIPGSDFTPPSISLSGGNIAASDSCTFTVDIDIPAGVPGNSFPSTSSAITGTFGGASVTGPSASDTLQITAGASVNFTKEFINDPVDPGATATLRFTLENPIETGVAASALTFTDDLNAALVGLAATGLPASNVCGMGSSITGTTNLAFTGGSLASGTSCTFDVSTTVPAATAQGTYTNVTSDLTGMASGNSFTAPGATADLLVGGGLSFTKEFLTNPVAPGEATTLRFTITNDSPTTDATITFFTDNLAAELTGLAATGPATVDTCGGTRAGTTFLTYVGGNVTSGNSCTIEIPLLVPAGSADGAYQNITSSLSANLGGAVVIDPATDTLTVQDTIVDVALTKEFTNDPVAAGGTANLEFTLTNNSMSAASAISFSDDLDAMLSGATANPVSNDCGIMLPPGPLSTVTISGVSLAAGSSCSINVGVDVPAAATPASYTNTTSSLMATVGGTVGTSAPAADDLVVGAGTATFIKAFDGPTAPGGTANLEFSITNTGTGALSDLRFTDDLNASLSGLVAQGLPVNDICGAGSQLTGAGSLSFSGGNLPISGSCNFSVTVMVPEATSPGSFLNTTSDLTSGSSIIAAPATATLAVEPPPAFSKVFAPDTITAGDVSTLTFTIDNSGSAVAASNLAFVDSFPTGLIVATPANAGTTCTGGTITAVAGSGAVTFTDGTVAAGASCSVSVDTTSSALGNLVNVTGDLTSSSGNSGTATDSLTVNGNADLTVTKTDGVTTATPGGSLTYTIVASNIGTIPDRTVSLTDNFPADLTCNYTSVASGGATGNTAAGSGNLAETLEMPSGASVTYTAVCAIDSAATGTLSNTTTISGSVTDSNPANNSATDNDTVLSPSADLSVSLSDNVDPAVNGATVIYTAIVQNNGPSVATNALGTITLPAGLTLVSTAGCAEDPSGVPTCSLGTIGSSSSEQFTITATVDAGATGTLSTSVAASSDAADLVTGNNSASETTTVNEVPVANAGPDQPAVIEAATVTLDGTGSSDPNGTAVTFAWTQTGGTPTVTLSDAAAASPTFTAPTLSSNTPVTLTFSLVINDGVQNSVADTVDITINNVNGTPLAAAGADQPAVVEATSVTLDGTGSSDPDGDTLTYAWTQTGGTPTVTLSDAAVASPTFTAPGLSSNTPVTLTFSLVVNDGTVSSVADTVDVTVTNVNGTPLAAAGADQPAVVEATSVTLDGTGSSDPDGDTLTYAWTQTGGTPTVTLSDAAVASPTFTAPTLSSNTPVTLTFSLVVNDGTVSSVADTVDVTVTNVNGTPLAAAGADQPAVVEATSVTLDGTGSSDPDGDTLTYAWTQTGGTPTVTLSDAAVASPTFTAPGLSSNTPVTLTFSLVVNDGTVSSVADTVDVTVTNVNGTPLAAAGADQPAVVEATSVTLDGTGSSDPDGDTLTYAWTQTGGTPTVTLSDAAVASPTFTAPTLSSNTPVTLTFSLVVNDGTVSSVADTVDVTVTNVNGTPLAAAGADQPAVVEATSVTLDGTGSSDPDGDTLTYAWTQTGGTPTVTLSDAAVASPTFTAPGLPATTTLTFSLTVNDGTVNSTADAVQITILENAAPTVVISGAPTQSNASFTATFTFSETVSGFEAGDIALANATASDFAGSGAVYTALITPDSDGTVTIDVPAAVAQDSVGNDNIAAPQVSVTFDTTRPTVELTAVSEARGPFTLTITFDEAVTGFDISDLTVSNGTPSNFVTLANRSFTVLITPTSHGTVTMEVAAGVAQDMAGNTNEASNSLSADFIDENFVRTRTMATINNFLVRRADQMTVNDPNLALRMLNKGTNGRITGSADNDRAQVSLVASASGDDANLYKLVGADTAARINMWVEANFSRLKADTSRNNLALAFAGVDYSLNENTVIGMMAQYDWSDEENDTENISISGEGWMAGPYVVSRLTDNLVFDGRVAWGRSNNDVSPFRTYTDEFKTSRWLLKGQFTGDFDLDEWRINPSLSVTYFEDNQKAYTDSLNINIPGQTVKLGRAIFGPQFTKTYEINKKVNVVPTFGLRGIWDFEKTDIVNLNSGLALGTDDLRARTEAGLIAYFDTGTSFGFNGFYDGIGASNFEAYGVRMNLNFEFD